MHPLPYLHFPGTCAEALRFYAEVFGGTDLQLMSYDDAPGTPADWRGSGRVMHGQVTLDGGALMASDFPPGMEGDPQKAVSVMKSMRDVPTARAAFDRLMEGGDPIHPFAETFWSPGFGMVRDRFGTHWIISALPAAPDPDAD